MRKIDPVRLGPFPQGMNNVAPDHALPEGSFRDAVNLDITNSGTLKRRGGYTEALAGSNIVSAWGDGVDAYCVDGTTMYSLTASPTGTLTKTAVTNSVGALLGSTTNFCKTATHIAVSDRHNLYYLSGTALHTWTASAPVVQSTSGGTDGVFLLATTTLLDDGSESAPSVLVRVTGSYPLTVTVSPQSRTTYLYASSLNGTHMYRAGEITSGTLVLNTSTVEGMPLLTANYNHLPAGQMMRFGYGRLWSVVDNAVFYSVPMYFNLYDATANVLLFPSKVTAFEVLTNGYLVGLENEIGMLRGSDVNQAMYTRLLPFGVVPGTCVEDPRGGFLFMTKHGLHHISLEGQLTPLHHDRVAVETATAGSAGILISDGSTRAITSLFNGAFSGTVASSFMDAEIVRKETIL
jgi:hypothetical protein